MPQQVPHSVQTFGLISVVCSPFVCHSIIVPTVLYSDIIPTVSIMGHCFHQDYAYHYIRSSIYSPCHMSSSSVQILRSSHLLLIDILSCWDSVTLLPSPASHYTTLSGPLPVVASPQSPKLGNLDLVRVQHSITEAKSIHPLTRS